MGVLFPAVELSGVWSKRVLGREGLVEEFETLLVIIGVSELFTLVELLSVIGTIVTFVL
mgnify:CR=1 FL=1